MRPHDEPAFPCEEHPENTLLYTGMTIGDVFAAVAMHALISRTPQLRDCDLAVRATAISREMLALREKPDQTISKG